MLKVVAVVSLIAAVALAAVAADDVTPIIPFQYPLYKQCDPRWGSDEMVTTTICDVGCLMSSVSMALGGHDITIDGKQSNPGTLNAWLRTHNGYDNDNDLFENVVDKVDPSKVVYLGEKVPGNALSYEQVQSYLTNTSTVVIANVMHGHHFVLGIGYTPTNNDTLYVNDPGFNKTTYSISQDVVGWRLYTML